MYNIITTVIYNLLELYYSTSEYSDEKTVKINEDSV